MRVLLIGLGIWGLLWYKKLVKRNDISLVGVADRDENTFQKIKKTDGCKFFTDAKTAMDELKPDFILNATPPDKHRIINDLAFDRYIPILSEKPIADKWEDVLHIYSRAADNQKIMIGENYRHSTQCRLIKDYLVKKKIGNLTSIRINFHQRHFIENYHTTLIHPMLLDVGIHHLDMLRFFTESEAENVYADFFTPAGSWYKGYSNAVLLITMKNGVKAVYNGSLDMPAEETGWYSHWVFTGDQGILRYQNDLLILESEGQTTTINLPDDNHMCADATLDSFLAYLQKGILPETHITDNIKTQYIVHAALCSFEKGIKVNADFLNETAALQG